MGVSAERQYGPAREIPSVIPGLDGLRAISIMLVMISHSALSHIVPGVFGVTIFFFVSGFLITSLMIAEHRKSADVGIKAFYLRRFIRLYPPLVVSIIATIFFYTAIGKSVDWRGALGALAYLANYLALFQPAMMQNLGGQLWSLAVEEHFYFIYPLFFLWAIGSQKRFVTSVIAVCALSLAVRVYVDIAHPAFATDYNGKATETRIDSILFGVLAAYLWWSGAFVPFYQRHWKVLCAIAAALILISFVWRNPVARETIRYTAQGLALVPLILAVTVAGSLPWATRPLESSVAKYVGRLSYSLYLWHILAFEMGEHVFEVFGYPRVAGFSLGWVLAFAFAMLSYRYVETPFFALRKRFGSNVDKIDRSVTPEQDATVRPSRHPSADISNRQALPERLESDGQSPAATVPRWRIYRRRKLAGPPMSLPTRQR